MDCTTFDEVRGGEMTPAAYLCGMVDKLYNAYFNPRISGLQLRQAAEMKMLSRFGVLRIHDHTPELLEKCNKLYSKYDTCIDPKALEFLKILITIGSQASLKYYHS